MPGVHVSPRELSSRAASLLDREIQLYCTQRDGGIFSTVIFGGPATLKVEQPLIRRCAGPDARDDAVLIS